MTNLSGITVVITGSSGYIAGRLIERLITTDVTLVRVTRGITPLPKLEGQAKVVDIVGSMSDNSTWEKALEHADVVFHLGGQTSVYTANNFPLKDLDYNIVPTLLLLKACCNLARPPVLIFPGTVTEAGITETIPVNETFPDHPITIYDQHKLMAEMYIAFYSLSGYVKGVVLRLPNVYGPGPKSSSADRGVLNAMIRSALRGDPLTIYGTGNYLRDYIFVEDVVSALISAWDHSDVVKGKHFVIGTGIGTSIADAFNLVAKRVELITGKAVEVVHVDEPASLSPVEKRNFVADASLFMKYTGWQPLVDLAEGIDMTIRSFMSQE